MNAFPKLPPYTIPEQDADLWECGRVGPSPRVPENKNQRAFYEFLLNHGGWVRCAEIAQAFGKNLTTVRKHLYGLRYEGWLEERSLASNTAHVEYRALKEKRPRGSFWEESR